MPDNGDSKKNPSKEKRKSDLAEMEKRLVISAVAIILIVVAILLVVSNISSASTSSLKKCQGIIFTAQRNECLLQLANSTKNYSVCSYVSSLSSSYYCISSIAQYKRDVNICSTINSKSLEYDNCVDNVSAIEADANNCLTLKGTNESLCAYVVARANAFDNQSFCGVISNATQKSLCNNIYYLNDALTQKKASYCSMLPNSLDNSTLAVLLTESKYNQSISNLTYFAYLELNMTPAGLCYYGLAASTKNQSLCSYTTGATQELCSISSANTTAGENTTISIDNLSTYCSDYSGYNNELCTYTAYSYQAIHDKNVSVCLKINTTYYQDSCIVALATTYTNSSYCDRIANSTAQEACVISAKFGSENVST